MKYQKVKSWNEIKRGDIGIEDRCIWICFEVDVKRVDEYRVHIERGVEISRFNKKISFFEDEPWGINMYYTKIKRGKQ